MRSNVDVCTKPHKTVYIITDLNQFFSLVIALVRFSNFVERFIKKSQKIAAVFDLANKLRMCLNSRSVDGRIRNIIQKKSFMLLYVNLCYCIVRAAVCLAVLVVWSVSFGRVRCR